MKIELSDTEVREAIKSWLSEQIELPSDDKIKISRLYLDGSGGFEAVVELPDFAAVEEV